MYTINNTLADQACKDLQLNRLIKSDSFEVISVSLEAGHLFPEHISPKTTYLILLKGEINFYIEEKTFHLNPRQVFDFPANTKHHVKALTDSNFLIIR
jgi:quercetin dioxygenase-like cupin family protein